LLKGHSRPVSSRNTFPITGGGGGGGGGGGTMRDQSKMAGTGTESSGAQEHKIPFLS